MKIYFLGLGEGADEKLPDIRPKLEARPCELSEGWLWVIHPPGRVKQELTSPDVQECLRLGGAVLFVRGQRYAEETAQAVEGGRWAGRVYCLRSACTHGAKAGMELHERCVRFFAAIKRLAPYDAIPWQLLIPPASTENLLALYAVLIGLGTRSPERVRAVATAWEQLGSETRRRLIQKATEEYYQSGDLDGVEPLIDLDLSSDPEAVRDRIRTKLRQHT